MKRISFVSCPLTAVRCIFFLAFIPYLLLATCYSQTNIFTAGFQYKPIFSSAFFSTGIKTVSQNGIDFSISQKFGYCAGMVLRRGFTKRLSMETGINYVKRNFGLSITDTSFTGKSDFTIIGYEIPVQLLIFLQASKKGFINTSMGLSWDMYPSNITTKDTYFKHNAKRHSLFQGSALANLGYEYRTEKSGYFYIGASYHLPLSYFYVSSINYTPNQEIARMKLGGNYLTFDFRYYFHEEPLKPKKEKKKKKKEKQ
ncbi:MAG: hypothetical protein HY841_11760 [Bacteroidetes bacterium]|nr:hypothetical protein [Bacteroidota bacterium]